MKKNLMTLVLAIFTWMGMNAMDYETARERAYYLTDKMAYELNLNDQQYNDAYEINLDYLLSLNTADDLAEARYLAYRNDDLRHILYDWQWRAFAAVDYLFRPVWWLNGGWYFPVFRHYAHGYYFYHRPAIFWDYRGGHGRFYFSAGFYHNRRPIWHGGLRGMHHTMIGHPNGTRGGRYGEPGGGRGGFHPERNGGRPGGRDGFRPETRNGRGGVQPGGNTRGGYSEGRIGGPTRGGDTRLDGNNRGSRTDLSRSDSRGSSLGQLNNSGSRSGIDTRSSSRTTVRSGSSMSTSRSSSMGASRGSSMGSTRTTTRSSASFGGSSMGASRGSSMGSSRGSSMGASRGGSMGASRGGGFSGSRGGGASRGGRR